MKIFHWRITEKEDIIVSVKKAENRMKGWNDK